MCGIAGLFDPDHRLDPQARRLAAQAMADALARRGPDGEGFAHDDKLGFSLVHRRLAIIDLRRDADQPMVSPGGQYLIVFNGEIYNYREMAADLADRGVQFDAQSDTRVLLAAIETFGLTHALERSIGMFAFILIDLRTGQIQLGRDRFGVKPLSYGRIGPSWMIASELGAIEAAASSLDLVMPPLDPSSLSHYALRGHVADGASIYQGLAKVPPGAIVSLQADGTTRTEFYWRYQDVCAQAQDDPFTGGQEALVETLHDYVKRAVGYRLVADVPVGIFLSGGIDSSLIAALTHTLSNRPGGAAPRAFTIGFDDMGLNEAPMAQAVARHIGIDLTTIQVTGQSVIDMVPGLGGILDEPLADAAAVPMLVIAREARRHVSVALSGDGGDEGFGGYARHIFAQQLAQSTEQLPQALRRILGAGLHVLSPELWDRTIETLRPILPKRLARRLSGARLTGLGDYLAHDDAQALYDSFLTQWLAPGDLLRHPAPTDTAQLGSAPSLDRAMMNADMTGYLPGDVLTKVDRTTMAYGLEAREPLLDHHLLAFAARLGADTRYANGKGKRALAQVLARYVPDRLVDRPKQGFTVPMEAWLRGPLRNWAQDLIAPSSIDGLGLFMGENLRDLFKAHCEGRLDAQHRLWNALCLIAWIKARKVSL
jgi:asparagine synthase (glutamine-hydrolysing)